MLPSVLFSLQLIKFNQKCTHTSTKGTKGLKKLYLLASEWSAWTCTYLSGCRENGCTIGGKFILNIIL